MTPAQQALIERLEARTKPVAFMPGLSESDADCREAAAALRLAWTPSGEAKEIAEYLMEGVREVYELEDDGDYNLALALHRYGQEQAAKAYERVLKALPGGQICDPQEIADAIRALEE